MNKLIITFMFCLMGNFAFANDFIGMWKVTKVDIPKTYFGEIMYPKYFKIIKNADKISGYYKDQYDFECKFPLAELVNGEKELLLMNCGTTKFEQSWAPLHKVKLIKGQLVGTVVTHRKEFVWYASPIKNLPF